jgi:hypothetical protein
MPSSSTQISRRPVDWLARRVLERRGGARIEAPRLGAGRLGSRLLAPSCAGNLFTPPFAQY